MINYYNQFLAASVLAILTGIIICCNIGTPNSESSAQNSIRLLPLGKIDQALIQSTYTILGNYFINIELLPHEKLPQSAFYKINNRYRADSIISRLRKRAKKGEVYVAITMQDISTTKGNHQDWGIMGLAYTPGNACVVSNYRLKDKSNFYKVVFHEMGHTTGLLHCPEKSCFMRDAKGGDLTKEETEFCNRCKTHLVKKGGIYD